MPRFPVEQWTLANGLHVVVQPDAASPLVASQICYRAGSRWDPESRSGLAHLCEHLTFEGPSGGSDSSFAGRIESVGGSTQAVTTTDRLSYSAIFPRRELAAVLAIEAERMSSPPRAADCEALEIQRRVLLEELHERSLQRARAGAFEQIHRLLYPPGHPYHRPPAGEPDGIRAVTAEEVEAFAAAHLVPQNAVLVLTGDLSVDEAAELVRRAFEELPAAAFAPPPASPPLPPPAAAGERHLAIPSAVAQAQVYLAWSVPGFGRDGWHLAALLMRGLAAGRSSPLARELVEAAGLADEVHPYLVTMCDASTLVFAAVGARGVDGPRLERGLLDAVERLLSGGLSAAGLERAHKKALSDHYFAVQRLEWRADLLASLACHLGTPERLEDEPRYYAEPEVEALAAFAAGLWQQADRALLSFVPAGAAS